MVVEDTALGCTWGQVWNWKGWSTSSKETEGSSRSLSSSILKPSVVMGDKRVIPWRRKHQCEHATGEGSEVSIALTTSTAAACVRAGSVRWLPLWGELPLRGKHHRTLYEAFQPSKGEDGVQAVRARVEGGSGDCVARKQLLLWQEGLAQRERASRRRFAEERGTWRGSS